MNLKHKFVHIFPQKSLEQESSIETCSLDVDSAFTSAPLNEAIIISYDFL